MSHLISTILLLLPTYLIRFSVLGIPSTFLEVLIYLVFVIGLFQAFKNGFRSIPARIYLPIGLLVVALVISTIISPDKRTALGEFKGFFVDPILVFWLIYQFVKEKDIPKIFIGLIFSGFFVSLFTIFQKIFGEVTADGRVIGIFGYSPNYVALFLAPIAVLAITYGISLSVQKKYSVSIFYFLFSIFYLVAIFFSGSRGGFLAIVAGVGSFLFFRYWEFIKNRIFAKIIISIVILLGIYTAWSFLKPDLSASTDAGRVASSNNIRYLIWQASLELAKTHPILGVGLGYFQEAFSVFTRDRINFSVYISPWALTTHNIFLMFYLSTGLLGLLGFLGILVNFFRETMKKSQNTFTPILFGGMTSILAYGLIESSIWKNDLGIIFWAIWGLIWII